MEPITQACAGVGRTGGKTTLQSVSRDSAWQVFIAKVFIEHLLCASSFIAYGSESNGPGLQHRGSSPAVTALTSALRPHRTLAATPLQRGHSSVPTLQMGSSKGGWELQPPQPHLSSLPFKCRLGSSSIHGIGHGGLERILWAPPFSPYWD